MGISHADFLVMDARLKKACGKLDGPAPRSGGAVKEAELHEAIRSECRRRGWICLIGSMAHRAHRTIGEWDATVVADHGRVFFCEMKTATGKLSTEQAALHAWAAKLGHKVHVIRDLQSFLNLIDNRCESKESGKEIDNR